MTARFFSKVKIVGIPVLLAGMLFSCKNDLEQVKAFAHEDEFPFQTTFDVTYTFTEEGKKVNELSAGEVNRYGADTGRTELSSGFKLVFFDSIGQIESQLTALNGIQYHQRNMLIARDSVKFTNELGETLETSELIMDRDSAIIYTDKPIKIVRDETIIYGDGLRADESFSKYRIRNPRGSFYIEDEELQ